MNIIITVAIALMACACAVSAYSIWDTPVHLRDLNSTIIGTENNVVDIESRITNGIQASNGQFPYQVSLFMKIESHSFWCGGSLIGPTWVLTAAHCTDKVTSGTVYIGSNERNTGRVTYTISSAAIYQHSRYAAATLANDVSLIKIPAVKYSSYIKPVRLPSMSSSYSTYVGSYAIASGWGRTSDYSDVALHLNFVRLEVITNSQCALSYGSTIVTADVLCVSTPGGKSTCQGDSGGPLVLESSQQLIGITSFVSGTGCKKGLPAGFVRVTNYLKWIKDITGIYY